MTKPSPNPGEYHVVHNGSDVRVGRFTYGVPKVRVRAWGEGASLSIGSFCSLAHPITILLGGEHHTDWISTYPFGHVYADRLEVPPVAGHPFSRGDVTIGNDVWIAAETTILSGVTIGDGAVIGTRAVVARDVGPYEIVAGNPARKIRDRFDPETRDLLLRLQWWNLPLDDIKHLVPVLAKAPSAEELRLLVERYRP